MGNDQTAPGRRRYTVGEAAEIIGVSVEAVRGRIKRNTLEHERTPEGVFVLLEADQPPTGPQPDEDQSTDQMRPVAREDLIDELRDRVRFLEGELERRGEEAARYQEIVGRLSIANAQLSARLPELEAAPTTSEDTPQSPVSPGPSDASTDAVSGSETDVDEQQGRGPVPDTEAPQEPAQPRSWWRRMFGG